MLGWAKRLFPTKAAAYRPVVAAQPRRIIVTGACLEAIGAALAEAIERRHEGIVYLFGQTDGFVNAGEIMHRRAGAKTHHSIEQEGPRYRGPSCFRVSIRRCGVRGSVCSRSA
jgi:hypothetical protein